MYVYLKNRLKFLDTNNLFFKVFIMYVRFFIIGLFIIMIIYHFSNWGTENDGNYKPHNGNTEPKGFGKCAINFFSPINKFKYF